MLLVVAILGDEVLDEHSRRVVAVNRVERGQWGVDFRLHTEHGGFVGEYWVQTVDRAKFATKMFNFQKKNSVN